MRSFAYLINISARTGGVEYDKQGNITHLERHRSIIDNMDMMDLSYNGNQLLKVNDADGNQGLYNLKEYIDGADEEIEFEFDNNGNLIKDYDRGIVAIKYNILNLPDVIQFKTGNQIKNVYDAGGQKLSSRFFTGTFNVLTPISMTENSVRDIDDLIQLSIQCNIEGVDYIANKEYNYMADYSYGEIFDEGESLYRVLNSEGEVIYPTVPIYNYFRKDHLGNIREVWQAAYTVNNTPIHSDMF